LCIMESMNSLKASYNYAGVVKQVDTLDSKSDLFLLPYRIKLSIVWFIGLLSVFHSRSILLRIRNWIGVTSMEWRI